MASGDLQFVYQQLRRMSNSLRDGHCSDKALLERFCRDQDESAFEVLVDRYGPMVFGVCRRALQNTHDAEDAFQATFLILAQKAKTLERPNALGCWLHEVALRTAIRARTKAAQRKRHEKRATNGVEPDCVETVTWRDVQPVLDEEVCRLPKQYRSAFVLCYLEGKTYEQAGEQLGCRPGTISRRLSKARELLRARLTRRGITLPVGFLGAILSRCSATTPVSAALINSTDGLVRQWLSHAVPAATISTQALTLAEEGVRTMSLGKMKLALLAMVSAIVITAGLVISHRAFAQKTAKSQAGKQLAAAPRTVTPVVLNPDAIKQTKEAQQPQVVTGTVIDHQAKPVANAWVAVIGLSKNAGRASAPRRTSVILGQVKTTTNGRYRVKTPVTSPADYYFVALLAYKPGYAPTFKTVIKLGAKRVGGPLQLPKAKMIRGRLIDIQGQPAAGVKVQVIQYETNDDERSPPLPLGDALTALKAWPTSVTTDKDGRFTIQSVAKGYMAVLKFGGDGRHAWQTLYVNPTKNAKQLIDSSTHAGRPMPFVQADWNNPNQHFTWALPSAQIIEGVVHYSDTGKPAPRARVIVFSGQGISTGVDEDSNEVQTDANGKFRIYPKYGDHISVTVIPQNGAPYLMQTKRFLWKQTANRKKTLAFKLPRAVLMQGTVTEANSGKPVGNATVEYFAHKTENPFFKSAFISSSERLKQLAATDAKGNFQLPVLPGKGFLLINTSDPRFVRTEMNPRVLATTRFYLHRFYPQGLVKLDIKPNSKTATQNIKLQLGVTLRGKLVDPEGKPVKQARILFRHAIPYGYEWRRGDVRQTDDGDFELPGLDPAKKNTIHFLNEDRQLGVTVELTGKQMTKKRMTITMQPCGSAKVRLVDEKGTRIKKMTAGAYIVLSSGPAITRITTESKEVLSDMARMMSLDHKRYQKLQLDKNGYFTLPTLIPGAKFRLYARRSDPQFEYRFRPVEMEFTVEPGKKKNLGDIILKIQK